MSRARLLGLVALAVVAVGAGYTVDQRNHQGKAVRHVELAGHPVGGLARPAIARLVDQLAPRVARTDVRVELPHARFRATGPELGLAVDRRATVDAALAVGRRGTLPGRVVGWVRGLAAARAAPVRVTVDPEAVARIVARRDPESRREPVEPTIAWEDGRFVAVPGRTGRGIDTRDVLAAIRAADAGTGHVTVSVVPGPLPPRGTDEDAQRLAVEAQAISGHSLVVDLAGTTVTVRPSMLRRWLTTRVDDAGRLDLAVDRDRAAEDLRRLAPDVGTPAADATFAVAGGRLQLVPARTGRRCCAPGMTGLVLAALRHPPAKPVTLPLETDLPHRTDEQARALGIVEPVGTFTTRHKPGEPRVTNIHRIADLVRGQIIEPGKSFSVNKLVGKRTTDKGFVPAGAIEEGVFVERVGGGVSQFATTLFNAAFFAGLDFGEHQSHSIYISRYPYGREATLSWPHPDLVIENETPYGVLIWTSWTGTAITVTLYSTKNVESEQTGQTTGPRGSCTVVVTERTRHWLATGKTEVDKTRAVYRPAEGVAC